jgi:SAM-dependent methyltransferase
MSAWMARRGARPVGIDNSPKQLENAHSLQREHGLQFPLLLGNAESVPYPDGSFDAAVSEYGASLWADPCAWIPEAARLLRPGGMLVFLTHSLLAYLCVPDLEAGGPADARLKRPMFGMHRITWADDETGAVEFHLAHGDWVRLLRSSGFDVEDIVVLRPPEGSTTSYEWMFPQRARSWPCEEVWVARKRA